MTKLRRAGSIISAIALACAFLVPTTALAAPTNDDAGAAKSVFAPAYSDVQDTSSATLESGEVRPCASIGKTVWYRYSFPLRTAVSANTLGSLYDTAIAVWRLDPGGGLSLVSCNDDVHGTEASAVVFTAEASTIYYIQAGGADSAGGVLKLNIEKPTPHDQEAEPMVVLGAPFVHVADTRLATVQPGEDTSCGPMGATVWYRFDPSQAKPILADTLGSDFDTVMAVWRVDNTGAISNVGCNDNNGPHSWSAVKLTTIPGSKYFFQVGGRSGASGELKFALTDPATHDDASGARVIEDPLPYEDSSQTLLATVETIETLPCEMASTVWYRYTAQRTQSLAVSTAGSSYRTAVAVWKETSTGSVDLVGCVGSSLPGEASFDFDASPGNYYFQVGGVSGDGGQLRLKLEQIVRPPNDVHQTATTLEPGSADIIDTTHATSVGEPVDCGAPLNTVWYFVQVDERLPLLFDTLGSSYRTMVAVYRIDIGALTLVACGTPSLSGQTVAGFTAEPDVGYLIQVGGASESNRSGLLRVGLNRL